jgi:hypothetical protein
MAATYTYLCSIDPKMTRLFVMRKSRLLNSICRVTRRPKWWTYSWRGTVTGVYSRWIVALFPRAIVFRSGQFGSASADGCNFRVAHPGVVAIRFSQSSSSRHRTLDEHVSCEIRSSVIESEGTGLKLTENTRRGRCRPISGSRVIRSQSRT